MSSEVVQTRMWEQPARRWVAHVDMDAFFASVEQRDNPALAGQPLVVANSPFSPDKLRELAEHARDKPHGEYIRGIRGVVASASYEARVFGVRSAMPLARALVLCPNAVVLPGRFERYGEVSHRLRTIWYEFSPVIEPMSLDEAYLELTGCELSGGSVRAVGVQLKERIQSETGLTASVGIAANKLMSKIASDLEKPDGLVTVPHGEESRILAPMPVRVLPGVGPRTAESLDKLGISTVGQLAEASQSSLASLFGAEQAASLLRRAAGIDDSPVEEPGDPKSVSREITLVDDTCDLDYLRARLRELADRVAWTLRRDRYIARCVYIKLRLLPAKRVWSPEGSGFGRLITRQCTLPLATDDGQQVYSVACQLLRKAFGETGLEKGEEVVRLLGVGTASLTSTEGWVIGQSRTPDFGTESFAVGNDQVAVPHDTEKRQRLNSSMDAIRERFGFSSIAIGTTIKHSEPSDDD